MRIINKKYIKNRGLIQIILGNKKKWIGEIIFLNNIKNFYFILPSYNLLVFNLKIIIKNFESTFTYNENDILFDQNLKLNFEKNLSFNNYIKYIEQKKNNRLDEYRKLNILNHLKSAVVVPFSNVLFFKNNTSFLSNIVNSNLNKEIIQKSGISIVEIKKIFVN